MTMIHSIPDQQVDSLYQDHHGWLAAWLQRKLGCSHQAADLAQDVFIKLLVKQPPNVLREPRAYLTTIAHGVMVNYLRRREVEQAYMQALLALPEEMVPSVEQRLLVLETLFEIERMLAGLPEKVRQAFLSSQLDGMAYRDIAHQLGVSERMIKKYMARAMLACITVMEP